MALGLHSSRYEDSGSGRRDNCCCAAVHWQPCAGRPLRGSGFFFRVCRITFPPLTSRLGLSPAMKQSDARWETSSPSPCPVPTTVWKVMRLMPSMRRASTPLTRISAATGSKEDGAYPCAFFARFFFFPVAQGASHRYRRRTGPRWQHSQIPLQLAVTFGDLLQPEIVFIYGMPAVRTTDLPASSFQRSRHLLVGGLDALIAQPGLTSGDSARGPESPG